MRSENIHPFGKLFFLKSSMELEDHHLDEIKKALVSDKLVVLRGLAPLSRDVFLNFSLKFAEPKASIEEQLLHWSFGPIMELEKNEKIGNYLFSSEAVPFHWDGAFHIEPSYLVFNCIKAPAVDAGGETLFCDVEKVLNSLETDEKSMVSKLSLTFKTEKKAHYGGEVTVPMVFRHPKLNRDMIRYAEPVETELNPVTLEVSGMGIDELLRFQEFMKEKIYHKNTCYQHQWKAGDLLIVDNHGTIHGRNAFLKHTPRHIRRIQVL